MSDRVDQSIGVTSEFANSEYEIENEVQLLAEQDEEDNSEEESENESFLEEGFKDELDELDEDAGSEYEEIVIRRRATTGKTKWAGMKPEDSYQTIRHRKGDPYPADMVSRQYLPTNEFKPPTLPMPEEEDEGYVYDPNYDSGAGEEVVEDDGDSGYAEEDTEEHDESEAYEIIAANGKKTVSKTVPGRTVTVPVTNSPSTPPAGTVNNNRIAKKWLPGHRPFGGKGITIGVFCGDYAAPNAEEEVSCETLPICPPLSTNLPTKHLDMLKQSSARKRVMQRKPNQTCKRKRADVSHLDSEQMPKRKRKRASDEENETEPVKKVKKIKRGAWTDEEHDTLFSLLVQQRQLEKATGAPKLNDDNLWRVISKQMVEAGFNDNGGRTLNACRMYWQRQGRVRAGYDVGDGIFKDGLKSTSLQGKKAKKSNFKDKDQVWSCR